MDLGVYLGADLPGNMGLVGVGHGEMGGRQDNQDQPAPGFIWACQQRKLGVEKGMLGEGEETGYNTGLISAHQRARELQSA